MSPTAIQRAWLYLVAPNNWNTPHAKLPSSPRPRIRTPRPFSRATRARAWWWVYPPRLVFSPAICHLHAEPHASPTRARPTLPVGLGGP